MAKRVFSDEELQKMGARTLDQLTEAIERGDGVEAKQLAARMYSEFEGMHDLYMNWVTELMDFIYKNHGTDALYQAVRKIGEVVVGNPPDMRQVPFRLRVEGIAQALRGHLQPIKIEEDDEKVCMTMQPCGGGERLVQQGAYDPPRNCAVLKQPHVMTYGMTDVPIYCTHEPILEILFFEKLGYLAQACIPAGRIGKDGCAFCIYKNIDDVPEECYTRLGKQKPKRKGK